VSVSNTPVSFSVSASNISACGVQNSRQRTTQNASPDDHVGRGNPVHPIRFLVSGETQVRDREDQSARSDGAEGRCMAERGGGCKGGV
jgi:hypothetical protein